MPNRRKLNKKLPPINIRKKKVKGLFGTKTVKTTKWEQRKMKEQLMKIYPDRYYLDDLNEWNSVKKEWDPFDDEAFYVAFFDD